jgi:sporulation protein YlmC with PRC-barrel domain
MYGKDVIDKEVVGTNGWKIGKAKDVYFEDNNWQITYLDIELRGNIENELGMGSVPLNHNHLPIATSHIQGVGDVITLNTTKEEIVEKLGAMKKAQESKQQKQNSTGGVV